MNKGKQVKIFQFNEAYTAPVNKINPKRGIVEWGASNLFPNYLLNLYNNYGSTTHKSIINKKTKMISGQGFEDVTSPELAAFIQRDKLEFETYKATMDYELFNGFAFEVIWDRMGENIVSVKHIPYHKLRKGIETEDFPTEHYWYSNDWSQYRKAGYKPEYIQAYDKYNPGGRQVYYYTEYNPQSEIYPIAGYSTSINWIEMDYQISQFHLNQVKQGYSPSFILNFASGIPTEEEQDLFFREFKRNYSGSENSGKIIITYSEGDTQKPELIPIALNDSDDRFIMLMDQIERNIVMGAEIPPQLVVLTPGKLGSTDERKELVIEFQVSYVSPRQNILEGVLNEILSTDEIELKNYTV